MVNITRLVHDHFKNNYKVHQHQHNLQTLLVAPFLTHNVNLLVILEAHKRNNIIQEDLR